MDDSTAARARSRGGIVLAQDLGRRGARAARRTGMVEIVPGALVAPTQPVDVDVVIAALVAAVPASRYAVMGESALWLYGAGTRPGRLAVGVRLGGDLRVHGPCDVRRVADSVLAGARTLRDCSVVALEVAVVQAAERWTHERSIELVSDLVRQGRTTLARLRSRCGRGLKGSARIRAVCDELAGGSMDADVRRLQAALAARGIVLRAEVRFRSASGASAYADLYDDASATVIEVDGFTTHTTRERFRADRRRDRWMQQDHGAYTVRIDVGEIRAHLDLVADEVEALVLERRRRHAA